MATSKTSTLYLNIDMLRFFPPCRCNRDENNQQKTIIINGSERMQISSQCIKSAIRPAYGFVSKINKEELREQVKNYKDGEVNPSYYISEADVSDICNLKKEATNSKSKKKEETQEEVEPEETKSKDGKEKDNVVLYLSLENLHNICKSGKPLKKKDKVKEYVNDEVKNVPPDISLFGRMYASNKFMQVEACSQISHAISVHSAKNKDDLWVCNSSVDDENKNMGCLTMGTSGICSSLMYFNANVNISELLKRYSKEETEEIVKCFVFSYFTMRFNSGASGTAHNMLPSYFRVTVGNIAPENHFDAFLSPLDSKAPISEAIDILKDTIDKGLETSKCINKYTGIETKVESFDFDFLEPSVTKLHNVLHDMI